MPIQRKVLSVFEVSELQVVIYNNDECQIVHLDRNDRVTEFEEYLSLNRQHASELLREMILTLHEIGKINEFKQLTDYVYKTYNFTGGDGDIWPAIVNSPTHYTCDDCSEMSSGVNRMLCPYEEDVHGRDVHVVLCKNCCNLRAEEI